MILKVYYNNIHTFFIILFYFRFNRNLFISLI